MEYILFLIQKNIEISTDKTGSNKLILEKTPCKRGEVFTVNIAIVISFTSKSNYGINLGIIQDLQSQKSHKN